MGHHRSIKLRAMTHTRSLLMLAALTFGACTPGPPATDFSACPAAKPAMDVTDKFMAAFNAKSMGQLEATFHFPHIRIASYPLSVLTGPGQQDDVFGSLAAEGWSRSDWAERRVVQCSAAKAHMLATFVRYHANGEAYARYDGLYIIELRDGFWGITARSTFAP
jgi:hypothetical protein